MLYNCRMAQTAKTDLLATCIQPFVHVSELVYFFKFSSELM